MTRMAAPISSYTYLRASQRIRPTNSTVVQIRSVRTARARAIDVGLLPTESPPKKSSMVCPTRVAVGDLTLKLWIMSMRAEYVSSELSLT